VTCTDCRTEGADCLTSDRVRVCSDCLYERVVKERDEARAEVEREKASATRGWQTADELHLTVRDLKAEVARLRGVKPELPPRPPDGSGLPRYGLRWNGDPTDPVSVPMNTGYWTPWHLAEAELERFRNAVREKERLELEAVRELDEARAEVERLEGFFEEERNEHRATREYYRTVAEAQREACAEAAQDDVRDDVVRAVRATPLVTEGEK